jgi:Coenzyme PQQ synthesis protein D (PqqD)
MRYHRSSKVTWELVDERAVILDADGSTLTTLNAVGTLLWRDLDQPREAAELSRRLAPHFPHIDPHQLECDADEFLHLLAGDGLVIAAAA